MQFRVVTLNLEQDHKRWSDRHPLISAEIAGLRSDVIAFNEVCVPLQTARLLRDAAIAATGIPYKLVQQTRVKEPLQKPLASDRDIIRGEMDWRA